MPEISGPAPLPPSVPVSRPAQVNAADLAVKLLQPLEGLLAAGETAKAEVVTLKEAAQSFQLVLRLTLDSGKQTTVTADSSRPLLQGTTLAVTALSETRLALAIQAGGAQPLDSLDLEQLPVGTQVQGKVVSSVPLPAQAGYRVLVNLLNTSLAGSQLSLDSEFPLHPGSLLTAQVRDGQTLGFLPLSGRLDQLALNQQLANQLSRQGSLEGLFKAAQNADLPDNLRASLDQLFDLLPDGDQLSTGKGLAQALQHSGAFLEAKLLGGQSAGLSHDLKANLLRLIAQVLPNLPSASPLSPANVSALAQALPAFVRSALGNLGQFNARQQALSFPLPARLLQSMAEGEEDLETLLRLAAAAVSRLQTHQLSSLAQTQVTPEGLLVTTWQLELPMRNQQDIVPLQVKLQREEQEKNGKKDKEQQELLWRVELAFDLDPLGPLQIQAQLLRGSFSSQLWAERASTVELIDHELGHLRARLLAAGLEVGDLACRQGVPPKGPRTTLEQRWVDETA
jgi:hypothetical protein